MLINCCTLKIGDESINKQFSTYLAKQALKKLPMAILAMLSFLALTIKGVYDHSIDSKVNEATKAHGNYLRFNFLSALLDSFILIIIWRVNTRLTHLLGTFAALFFVLFMGQISYTALLLEWSMNSLDTSLPMDVHCMVFLFQLLGFQIYQSFFNVNYVAAQYLVVPAFYLSILIVHAWILSPLPGIGIYVMMVVILIYCCFMWAGTYESYMRNIELFLSRH